MKVDPEEEIAEPPAAFRHEDEVKVAQRTPRSVSSVEKSNNLSISRRGATMPHSSNTSFSNNETFKDSTIPRSHRSVDALRQSPMVELHRSSSGRNLRLKCLSVADEALLSAPNALTPRAPSGRKPESRQRVYSADCNASDDTNNQSNNDTRLSEQTSNSFPISAYGLKDLERVRSSTEPQEQTDLDEKPERFDAYKDDEDAQQQQQDGRDESEDNIHDDKLHHLFINQALKENDNVESKAVAKFSLWGKAPKSKCLPAAIIFSESTMDGAKPSHTHSSFSSRDQSIRSTNSSPNEMGSPLHITHPHLATRSGVGIPKSMSLTRSTSPRIKPATFSSLPDNVSFSRATSISDQIVELETKVCQKDKQITQWKRGEQIGEGTFGKVYKGLNTATGELFALKEIELHSHPNADQVTQMQKLGEEIGLMKNLRHKHIVRYEGSHRAANHFYIFMEYVPGGSIASMLKQFDAFSEDLIRIFTRQIVQGVIYLHQMGIIHRDIKGANVLVNEQGVSKLADFGCSKQIPQMLTSSLEKSLRSIRGSIPWMAPEVVKQTGHDYKADVWSIGATVIEMATAKHPWPHCRNGLAAMYAIAMATAPPPFPDHLSSEANSFLQRCFCIDPKERATALELSKHIFLAENR